MKTKQNMVQKLSISSYTLFFLLPFLLCTSCWKDRSPEDLIRLKENFKSQVTHFESKKEKVNKHVNKGLTSLGALKKALEDTRNEDKEFARVYGDWERVDKRVSQLNKEYEDLKSHANNLFIAMEKQTNSLSDQKNKSSLLTAIQKTKTQYNTTLRATSKAISKLRELHEDAVEVIKALEVAVALDSFDSINDQMKSIENRVDDIMNELNMTVVESKKLYDKKMTELNNS